jgi:hypothetical protein
MNAANGKRAAFRVSGRNDRLCVVRYPMKCLGAGFLSLASSSGNRIRTIAYFSDPALNCIVLLVVCLTLFDVLGQLMSFVLMAWPTGVPILFV